VVREHFLRANTEDPRAQHTVLWRYKPVALQARRYSRRLRLEGDGPSYRCLLGGTPWEAHQRWDDPEYRKMATQVLSAHLEHRHWETDQRFIVKNYYNYETRTL